jgi:DnaJ-class molecular chaperone
VEVNEAYNAICDEYKRQNYDTWVFGEFKPVRAHSIFDDFFGTRWGSLEDDFRPFYHRKWVKDLDNLMLDEREEKGLQEGQTVKTSSVYTSRNGEETGKTVTTKKTVKDGKKTEETTEDYLFPNGERKVTKTINDNGKVTTNEFKLKKGQEVPLELGN